MCDNSVAVPFITAGAGTELTLPSQQKPLLRDYYCFQLFCDRQQRSQVVLCHTFKWGSGTENWRARAKQMELKWKPNPGSGRCFSRTASGRKCPFWFLSGKQEWNTCNLFLFLLSDRFRLLFPCVSQWMIYSGQIIWPVFPMEAAMSIRRSQLNGWRQFTARLPVLWGHGSRKWAVSCIFLKPLPEAFRKKKKKKINTGFTMTITQI